MNSNDSDIKQIRITTMDTYKTKEEVEVTRNKAIRKAGDELIQRIKELPPSRERALAITKFQEGVMWIGMDLKRINEENPGKFSDPYPNSKDPSNTTIEPTADGLKL
jgi:hypothetical protein